MFISNIHKNIHFYFSIQYWLDDTLKKQEPEKI